MDNTHEHAPEPLKTSQEESAQTVSDNNESATDEDEAQALLSYLLHHSEHHIDEMKEASQALSEEGQNLIAQAIEFYEAGNAKIAAALDITDNPNEKD